MLNGSAQPRCSSRSKPSPAAARAELVVAVQERAARAELRGGHAARARERDEPRGGAALGRAAERAIEGRDEARRLEELARRAAERVGAQQSLEGGARPLSLARNVSIQCSAGTKRAEARLRPARSARSASASAARLRIHAASISAPGRAAPSRSASRAGIPPRPSPSSSSSFNPCPSMATPSVARELEQDPVPRTDDRTGVARAHAAAMRGIDGEATGSITEELERLERPFERLRRIDLIDRGGPSAARRASRRSRLVPRSRAGRARDRDARPRRAAPSSPSATSSGSVSS
jgi:hypothetical protein